MNVIENISKWETVTSTELGIKSDKKYDSIIINTYFSPEDLSISSPVSKNELNKQINPTIELVSKASKLLKDGGLIFIYGCPRHLSYYSIFLDNYPTDGFGYLFKYWIALEFKTAQLTPQLPSCHIGLAMHLKTKSIEQPTSFELNTKIVRIPYKTCNSCGLNVKDWGGKKHLLNKLGAAISDVWNEIDITMDASEKIPETVLQRIWALTTKEESSMLVILQDQFDCGSKEKESGGSITKQSAFIEDKIIHADSLKLMQEISEQHPKGVFDLVFADPPYNLSKNYSEYADAQPDKDYIDWCNSWLGLMCKILKPGGSLFVLNIPKWARYHAEFLNKEMSLKNWIAWDALSSPAGKLMPAHYALLYYTKPGGSNGSNYDRLPLIDSRQYCLRSSCIKKRKLKDDNKKERITDIWHDIHRIKHKRDRDTHPCQLPIKLMNRIIELATNEGDWVFDPFGGAGTTAISARICKRHFVISDIDKNYVEVSKKNLEKIVQLPTGELTLGRETVSRNRVEVSKKWIETTFIDLCTKLNYVPTKEQLGELNKELGSTINQHYPEYKKLMKIARRRLEIEGICTPS
ncbi:site-specific DNA-methyltransferase [Candidatus Micrarchaeota archaeon]|nr:site-specific DNA-methyltransferase [Candidatus Micrarchaeota archaeon]